MTVAIARTMRAAAITSGGPTQDFTISGFGTPKAALFIVTSGTVNDTGATHARMSVGLTDGTDEACVAAWSQSGVLVSNAERVGFFDGTVIDVIGGTGRATFDSFITDGVRINWGTLPSAAFLVTVILFGGASLSAKVVKATLSGSDGNTSSPTIGFQADQLITATYGCESGHFDGTVLDDAQLNVGIAQRGGGQFSKNWLDEDAEATAQLLSSIDEDRYVAQYITNETTLGAAIEVTAFGSTTVTFTERGAQTNGMAIAALALKYDAQMSSSCQQDSTPTVTGNKSYTTTGSYRPQFFFCLGTQLSALQSHNTGALAGAMSLCAGDVSAQFSNSIRSEDGAAASSTSSISVNVAEFVFTHTAGTGIRATFVSFDTAGWTLNYSSVGGNARVWMRLLIGEQVFAGSGTPSFPKFTGTGTGELVFEGSGSPSFPKFTGAGTGELVFAGSGDAAFPKFTGAGAGEEVFSGSGSPSFPKFVASGTGEVQEVFEGSGSPSFPKFTGAGVGELVFAGSGDAAFPKFLASGTGVHGTVVDAFCTEDLAAAVDLTTDLGASYDLIGDLLGSTC